MAGTVTRRGDELWLRPDLERAGWFDPDSGARLD